MTDLDALSALLAAATRADRNINFEGMLYRPIPSEVADALPSLIEAARREAGLDPYDMRIMVRALYVSGLTDDMNPVDRRKAAIRLRSSFQEQARLLHDNAGAGERGEL